MVNSMGLKIFQTDILQILRRQNQPSSIKVINLHLLIQRSKVFKWSDIETLLPRLNSISPIINYTPVISVTIIVRLGCKRQCPCFTMLRKTDEFTVVRGIWFYSQCPLGCWKSILSNYQGVLWFFFFFFKGLLSQETLLVWQLALLGFCWTKMLQ